ncbi:MarR family winged helix-turn-helix transcriptional regulator [Roseiconus lacunae]|uniref:MarR family transcriptional regulator n=1 Tax=Roseiconus lacunae TaxID=2605694 RepID=A0ABT7PN25_9BACT|nr:MarR family transcriptional regulator [Roseiconus lacunae]MCD0463291.1 MarR family transcriptional regulator [Roseiconus lacunae]MDM4017917.1 MarR family transcriptional regulator [Roseiconus lacunae]
MSLQGELRKRDPFDSLSQEAMLAVMRTSDLLENRMARLLREHGLTLTQYNVLRILRGEDRPMPCLEVADRMIQVAPAMTRVVTQLIKLGLVDKVQSESDRRVYLVKLTPTAKRLLKKLDRPVLQLHETLFAGAGSAEQKALIQILESVRGAINES